MNQIDQIKAEIEERIETQEHWIAKNLPGAELAEAVRVELKQLLAFIDSLPEEQPSEDLGEAIYQYVHKQDFNKIRETPFTSIENAFKAGAQWQKEQKPAKLNDDTEIGLDRALQIVKAARGSLCGYQSDDGIYECDHAIQTLERILKDGIEQLPAEWSKEDKHRQTDAIYFLETAKTHYADISEIELAISWLKSLRPKPHWKPSEEQMNSLKAAIEEAKEYPEAGANWEQLQSIFDQLKKL